MNYFMTEKYMIFGIIILMLALVAGTTIVLFNFPYEPDKPLVVIDKGNSQEVINEVVNANNQFAFDLYHELDKNEDGNVFYSLLC